MENKSILKLEKRRKIYNYILKYPGVHLSELSKKLDIPKTTLFYHLNYLKKHELVLVKTVDRFSRYYGVRKVGEKNKKLIDFLLKEKFLDKRYSPFIEYVDTIDDLEFLKPQ